MTEYNSNPIDKQFEESRIKLVDVDSFPNNPTYKNLNKELNRRLNDTGYLGDILSHQQIIKNENKIRKSLKNALKLMK